MAATEKKRRSDGERTYQSIVHASAALATLARSLNTARNYRQVH